MKVLINTIPYYGRSPGLRTHITGFLRGLHVSGADMEWHILMRPAEVEYVGLTGDRRFVAAPFSALAGLSRVPVARFVWRNATDQLLAARLAAGYDVVHYMDSYGPLVPPRRTPVVLTVHDVFPLLGRHYLPGWFEGYHAALMRTTIPSAQAILSVSATTAHQLTALLAVASDRIVTVPIGIDERFREPVRPGDMQGVVARHGVTLPYVLYAGSINPRKNVARLVRAFTRVRQEHHLPHHLVLAGGFGWQYGDVVTAIRESDLGDVIHLLGRIPDEDMPSLMAAAECLAYPSLDEGFGAPVIEAMACGTPVLTSAISPLRELAEGAALLVDPASEDAITNGLGRVLCDSGLRSRLREEGRHRASEYSWTRIAESAVEMYGRVSRTCHQQRRMEARVDG